MSFDSEIDRLANCPDCSFALFRLPEEQEPLFVLQTEGTPLALNDPGQLDGKRGFVISPFHITKKTPLLLLRPDIMAGGYDDITRVCSQYKTRNLYEPEGKSAGRTERSGVSSGVYAVYMQTFRSFIEPLQRKELDKLVLSRTLETDKPETFSPARSFTKACNDYPSAFVYLFHTPVSGTWIGSSPEVLLSGSAAEWRTVALAGTVKSDDQTSASVWNEKNYREQEFVSDYIRKQFRHAGITCSEEGPHAVRAGKVAHLQSEFRFRLENTGKLGSLLRTLHPTPAVCGLPKQAAFRFILSHEGHDRKYYAGFTGWLDPEAKSDIYVCLRCMQIHDRTFTLYAGGGILAASEAEEEWNETEAKLQTMLSIIP